MDESKFTILMYVITKMNEKDSLVTQHIKTFYGRMQPFNMARFVILTCNFEMQI